MFTSQEFTRRGKFSSKFMENSLIPKWLKPVWNCWEGASLPSREGDKGRRDIEKRRLQTAYQVLLK